MVKGIVAALTGQGYIGLVKEYINKMFVYGAKEFDHKESEIDVILRKLPNGEIRIYLYSMRDRKLLCELRDTKAEEILTS